MRASLVVLAFCNFAIGLPGRAQSGAPSPNADSAYVPTLTFDVASIRESPETDSYTVMFNSPPHSSVLDLTNIRVIDMIGIAYNVNSSRVVGPPDWVRETRYMVKANSDSAVDKKLRDLNDQQANLEKQHMLQVLLAQRFQLKVKQETREGTIYNLVVAKGGPKISTKLQPPTADQVAWFNGAPVPPIYQFGDGRLGYQFIAHGATMSMLAAQLAAQFDAQVIDRSGLAGNYDFVLQYSGTVPGTESRDPDSWPLLITALQEQLGLRLEPGKGPVEVLMIDHIEKPSPN